MSEADRKKAVQKDLTRSTAIMTKMNVDEVRRIQDGGSNLSEHLERNDPTSDYGVNMRFDAFERALVSQGIVPHRGQNLSVEPNTLQNLWENEATRNLAGEFFARQVRKVAHSGKAAVEDTHKRFLTSGDSYLGSWANQFQYPSQITQPMFTAAIPVAELVSRTEPVTGNRVRPYVLNDVDPEDVRKLVGEGADIPHVAITDAEKELVLPKEGIGILATYEKLRRMPLDILAIMVQRIAVKNEAKKVDNILDVLVSGDGNPNTAATNYNKTALDASLGVGDPVSVRAWLHYKMKWANPYQLTHILGQVPDVLDVMLIDTGSANVPLAIAGNVGSTQQFTPINHGLGDNIRTGWLNNAPAGYIVGFDSRYAIVRYYEIGSEIQEVAKWVEKQMEGLYMTENENYELSDPEANKTLRLDA